MRFVSIIKSLHRCSSRNYPYSQRRDWNFLWVRFLEDQKSLRNVWSLIRISRSAGGVLEKPFFEECMDIFLSYTKQNLIKFKFWDSRLLVTIKSIRHQNFKYVNLNQYEKRKTIGNTESSKKYCNKFLRISCNHKKINKPCVLFSNSCCF